MLVLKLKCMFIAVVINVNRFLQIVLIETWDTFTFYFIDFCIRILKILKRSGRWERGGGEREIWVISIDGIDLFSPSRVALNCFLSRGCLWESDETYDPSPH